MLVAGLLTFGVSAQVDLNPTAPLTAGTVVLANENTIDAAMGTDVSGTAYNVDGEAGFIIPNGETYYARIDLGGGATFGSDVATNFAITDADVSRAAGGNGSGSVILSLVATATVAVDTGWDLDGVTYTLNSKDAVSFTFSLYESATGAISGGTDYLSSQHANLVTFADATSMAGAATITPQIDVATSSVKYETGNSTTHVMKVNITNLIGDQLATGAGGVDLTLEDVVDTVVLTATGDFTAVAAVTEGGPAGAVWLDKDDNCTPDVPAGDNLGLAVIHVAGLEAVVTLTNTATETFGDISDAFLCMQTNGVSEIPEGVYTGVLSMTAATGHAAIANVSFTGSTLEKNSESAVLNFLLTPDGVFRNYVRLTNTSAVQGSNLTVTLINDAGDTASFPLDAVEGLSDALGPRASTPLININDLYAAAQALELGEDEEMFTVTGEGMGDKLRAKFEGSVLEGNLEAQALSVSTDNTTFFTF